MHALRRFALATTALLSVCGLGAACGTKSDPLPAPTAVAEVVSIPGIDTSVLTPRERREWSAQMTELIAPCPEVPVNLAQCIKENRACKACMPAAQLMLKLVQNGIAKKDRDELFRARFDPKAVKTVVTDGSPEKGSPDAVVDSPGKSGRGATVWGGDAAGADGPRMRRRLSERHALRYIVWR